MVDPWVTNVQTWVNNTYAAVPGFEPVPVTGRTGWATMYALTRALQHELGIEELSDTFGPTTLALLTALGPIGASTTNKNIIRIVQGGMYCKGYDGGGGELDGIYSATTTAGAQELRQDIGVSAGDGRMEPKIFKALLNMDAYVLIGSGSTGIRAIQRTLNARYLHRREFFVVPADGFFSPGVQNAMLYALQYEIGMDDDTANGNFGPGTQQGIREQANLSLGSSDGVQFFVHLFQAALTFNRYDTAFTGAFSEDTRARVAQFQAFAALPINGEADFSTWASLLVSTGDIARAGRAVDCVTTITHARAQTLKAHGYEIVGRYLTNYPGPDPLDKKIKPGELETIFSNGLRVFPIFQQGGDELDYFNYVKGYDNGKIAVAAARGYGFKRGTIIYYAVDFDAIEDEVHSNVVPYFEGIRDAVAAAGSPYQIGICGSRNTCIIVSDANLATLSFVSGMSTGYSGNLGYPLPRNWAFDQILEYDIGEGAGFIAIDKDIVSDRDTGQSSIEFTNPPAKLDVLLPEAQRPELKSSLAAWLTNNMNAAQIAAALRSREAAVDIIYAHDALFTSLAAGYRMRKALIQTATLWESALENVQDAVVDAAVIATYGYYFALEAWEKLPPDEQESTPKPVEPPILLNDASTGISQVYAKSAISAVNWGRTKGLTNEPELDNENWHHRWYIWNRLKGQEDFNVTMSALVLLWGASKTGITTLDFLSFTHDQVRQILAEYNGSDDYGNRNFNLYVLLEQANAAARGD